MDVTDKTRKLCEEILNMCRANLFIKLRYLDIAIFNFEFLCDEFTDTVAGDGVNYHYSPEYIFASYKKGRGKVAADYLHCVLHFVFKHPFVSPSIDRRLWNLSCDIASETIAASMGIDDNEPERREEERAASEKIRSVTGLITAEKVYDYFHTTPVTEDELISLEDLFTRDSHELWYPEEDRSKSEGSGSEKNETGGGGMPSLTEQEWEDISRRIQIDLESDSDKYGDTAGGIVQNIEEVTRDKVDYSSFLKKFARRRERMKINEDEFDYIFYSYGLQLYQNMPLIEPLEYKEIDQISEFVIAIDTSGSCHGKTVQQFLNKTYSILMDTESFFTKVNIHIIQCDAAVQNDYKITSRKEFDDYIRDMPLSGFGGTDFRPVFEYTDRMIENKELKRLNGLIYFTDGRGRFPQKAPAYPVAFIFVEENKKKPEVPPWAMQLVLTEGDIANLR
ncbi:MAG: VWA-like domain-containing protein [Eubacteriales bacterium]|nr:VWA-like domain-containing protein [Eubacteriales bacterium]